MPRVRIVPTMTPPLLYHLNMQSSKQPLLGTPGAAGYDMFSCHPVVISPGTRELIDTGVSVAIPDGFYGQLAPRSSLALKGVDVKAGVIDSDYRGSIKVLLHNYSSDDYTVQPGDKIAQLLILPVAHPELIQETLELTSTKRGDKGFGSTGR